MKPSQKLHFAWQFAFLVGCALSISSCSRPSKGMLELQASRKAMGEAQSWKDDVTVQTPAGTWTLLSTEKVECPQRMDRTTMLHDPHTHVVRELMYDGTYYSQGNLANWVKVPDGKIAAITCGQGPQLTWDGVLYSDLDAGSTEVRRGKAFTMSDEACEWWEVAPSKGAAPHYTVCIHGDNHLPYFVQSHEHDLNYIYVLSHWNETKVSMPEDIGSTSN